MIKQELLRGKVVQINMYNVNKTINSKAVFNQKDVKTAVLMCQLKLDGALNLTDCAVSAEILKPDGTNVVQKAQVMDAENGIVAVGLTEQCLSAIGVAQCELVVQSESQILYSPKISYIVVDNLFDVEGVESTNELPILNVLIAEVLKAQNDLQALDASVNVNEQVRNLQESKRESNEENRIQSMNKMKLDFEEITEKADEKVAEVEEEIKNSQNSTAAQVAKVDNKIIEINNRIQVINETLEDLIEDVNNSTALASKNVNDKIAQINESLLNVDATIQRIVSQFNEKLSDVDKSLSSKLSQFDLSLSDKLSEITNQVNERISGYNNKISEVNAKISEINNAKNSLTSDVNKKITEVDSKISGYNNKINEINSISSSISNAESLRVNAERERENTFNRIVQELEVTQSDIDDILEMVGGL